MNEFKETLNKARANLMLHMDDDSEAILRLLEKPFPTEKIQLSEDGIKMQGFMQMPNLRHPLEIGRFGFLIGLDESQRQIFLGVWKDVLDDEDGTGVTAPVVPDSPDELAAEADPEEENAEDG